MNLFKTFATMGLFAFLSGCDTAEKPEKADSSPPPRSSSSSSSSSFTSGGAAQSVRGAVARAGAQNEFRTLGQAYEAFRAENGKPPAKLEDLNLKKESPGLHAAIASGAYVVIWKAERSPETVLAYEAQEGLGGTHVVLMADGSVKNMDAQEFANTPKAKGK